MTLSDLYGTDEIDLHGYDVLGAIQEIRLSLGRRTEVLKVIHGRGTGVLRAGILAWARREGIEAQDSPFLHETGAVLYLRGRYV